MADDESQKSEDNADGEKQEVIAEEEISAEETSDQPETSSEEKSKTPSKMDAFKAWLTPLHVALGVAIVIIIALSAVIITDNNNEQITGNTDEASETDTDATEEDALEPLEDDAIHSEAGTDEVVEVADGDAIIAGTVDWEVNPVQVADQDLYEPGAITKFYNLRNKENGYNFYKGNEDRAIRTYRLGSTQEEVVYLNYVLLGVGLGDYEAAFFTIQDRASGGITLLKWHSKNTVKEADGSFMIPTLKSSVVISENGTIAELGYEDSLEFGGVTAGKVSEWYIPYSYGASGRSETITRLKDSDKDTFEQVIEAEKYGRSTLYEAIRDLSSAEGIKTYQLLLELPNGFRVQYRYITDLMRDDGSIPIAWNAGDSTEDVYRWDLIWAGCGAVNQPLVLAKEYHKDLEVVGNSTGQDVMWFKSGAHPVVKELYLSSSVGYSKTITRTEFYEDRPAIVVRNNLGYYLILNNEKYQRAAECAKPVIYLYPEQPTDVSVKVGADVTKSDPEYGDGWEARAYPDGTLLVDGQEYDSLFWDGLGHGEYPEITAGKFVHRSELHATLVSDLRHMGLNQKEIVDFMEYWVPLMPDSRFVRLTWFNTQEMNQLAPLELSFTPDSMLRVFLDFEGVDEPYDLPEQTLPRYEREGFTLVEWGGLRIGR